MPRFSDFDARGYRTVDVRTGYGEWVTTYEQTVEDAMDIELLESLERDEWAGEVADLGCGTGRTAAWLRAHGVGPIDGVDLTPEMLEVARERGLHERLVEADVADTGLEAGAYELVIASLVDEHLPAVDRQLLQPQPLPADRQRPARGGEQDLRFVEALDLQNPCDGKTAARVERQPVRLFDALRFH